MERICTPEGPTESYLLFTINLLFKNKTMFILFYFFAKSRKEECMRKKTKVYEMFNNFIAYIVLS